MEGEEEEHDEHWHKPLFPLDWTDVVGFLCASLGLMIAAGGGIGGGGMLVPIYILVMRFTPKYAIPLSNVTVFGGAVMNYVMNLSKRHPSADRPLVDWDLILVMQPMTIAGALLGSLANKLLPDLILTMALVVLLSYTTQTTLVKGFTVYNKETEQQKATAAAKESELSKLHSEEEKDGVAETAALLNDAEAQDSPGVNPELQAILDDEKTVPAWKIGAMWAIFVVVILVNLLKGGGGFASPVGITCGSPGYWMSTATMFLWILLVSYYLRGYLLSMAEKKRRLFYRYAEGDIEWDEKATIIYPVVCILAGLCAGMFGIGGGIVQVPLMLKIGINPKVASATSATMIMYTSFTAMTSFYVFGLLKMDYAVICLILGLCVTFIGQVGLTILIKRLGRDSLIIFSVAAVVGVSAVLMGTHSIIQLASSPSLAGGGGQFVQRVTELQSWRPWEEKDLAYEFVCAPGWQAQRGALQSSFSLWRHHPTPCSCRI